MLYVKDDFDVNLARPALFWFAAFVVIALVLRLGDWLAGWTIGWGWYPLLLWIGVLPFALAGWMMIFALEEWRP